MIDKYDVDIESARVIDTLKDEVSDLLELHSGESIYELISKDIVTITEGHEIIRLYVVKRLLSYLENDLFSEHGGLEKVERYLRIIRLDLLNPKFFKNIIDSGNVMSDYNSCEDLKLSQVTFEKLNLLVSTGKTFTVIVTIFPYRVDHKVVHKILEPYYSDLKNNEINSVHQESFYFNGTNKNDFSYFLKDQASTYKDTYGYGDLALTIEEYPEVKDYLDEDIEDDPDYQYIKRIYFMKVANSGLNSEVRTMFYKALNERDNYREFAITGFDNESAQDLFYHAVDLNQSPGDIIQELENLVKIFKENYPSNTINVFTTLD